MNRKDLTQRRKDAEAQKYLFRNLFIAKLQKQIQFSLRLGDLASLRFLQKNLD